MMKKIFYTLLFVLCCGTLFSQGNLQFNAVKYYSLNVTQVGSSVFSETTQSITVPSGKVWKIESAAANGYLTSNNGSGLYYNNGAKILLDGHILFEILSSGSGAYNWNQTTLPLWLPAGTYTLSLKSGQLVNGNLYTGYMSAIEFNIVP